MTSLLSLSLIQLEGPYASEILGQNSWKLRDLFRDITRIVEVSLYAFTQLSKGILFSSVRKVNLNNCLLKIRGFADASSSGVLWVLWWRERPVKKPRLKCITKALYNIFDVFCHRTAKLFSREILSLYGNLFWIYHGRWICLQLVPISSR